MSAEQAYLFRHALVREGAYQLLTPDQRGRLHRLAIDAIEGVVPQADLEPHALELADHALLARQGRRTGNVAEISALCAREAGYLRRAAEFAGAQYRVRECASCWRRLAGLESQVSDRVEALSRSGQVLTRHGLGLEAEQTASEALELAQSPECSDAARGRALTSMGVLHYTLGRNAAAEAHFRQAQAVLAPLGGGDLAQASMNLGVVFTVSGRRAEAEEAYQAAISQLRAAGDRDRLPIAIANLGNLHTSVGNIDAAMQFYDEALQLARETGDLMDQAVVLDYLGTAHSYQGRWEQALEAYTQAISIRVSTQDRTNLATTYGNIGNVCGALGRTSDQYEYYRKALEIHREAANPAGVCTTMLSIAGGTLEAGEHELAQAQIEEAAAAANSPRLQGTCEGYFAILAVRRRDLPEAQRRWELARPLLEVSGSAREQGLITTELRKLLAQAGLPAEVLPGL